MRHLQDHGIECREMMPLTCQPCYEFDEAAYPAAQHINESGLYLPCHQDLTIEQLDYMVDMIGDYFATR
jgi:dTDP-4-amino-4,6-dideoxygalactose transaminase